MNVTIWHNPRCSKSRQTLAILQNRLNDDAISIVKYLEDAPSKDALETAINNLDATASDIVRKGEALFKELGLKGASEDELLDAMAENPKLIERPIVFVDGTNRVAIGRPPENVESLFDE